MLILVISFLTVYRFKRFELTNSYTLSEQLNLSAKFSEPNSQTVQFSNKSIMRRVTIPSGVTFFGGT